MGFFGDSSSQSSTTANAAAANNNNSNNPISSAFSSSSSSASNDFVGQQLIISNYKLRVSKLLAEGGFAIVYVTQDLSNGQEYALKRIFAADEQSARAVREEIAFLVKEFFTTFLFSFFLYFKFEYKLFIFILCIEKRSQPSQHCQVHCCRLRRETQLEEQRVPHTHRAVQGGAHRSFASRSRLTRRPRVQL